LKAKVVIEALRDELPASHLATKHGVRQTMIRTWKRQSMEGPGLVFSGRREATESTREEELGKLHAEITKLAGEQEF
jgi:transposase